MPLLADQPAPTVEALIEEASQRELSLNDLYEIIEASLAPLSALEEAFVMALVSQS